MNVQKPFGNFVRAVLLMPLYVPLFSPKAYSSDTASTIYVSVLKVTLCILCRCSLMVQRTDVLLYGD